MRVTSPSAQPPTWTTKVGLSFFAWHIILGPFGKGGSTRSLSSSRLSPQGHSCTQASSPRHGGDTFEDEYYYYYYYYYYHHHHLLLLPPPPPPPPPPLLLLLLLLLLLPFLLVSSLRLFICQLLLLFVIFLQGIYKYMYETNRVSSVFMLQLCCGYNLCYMQCYFPCWMFCTSTIVFYYYYYYYYYYFVIIFIMDFVTCWPLELFLYSGLVNGLPAM